MKHTTTGVMALALAALAGCAQSPIPLAGNDLTEQKKVRSTGHWQVVARDAAQQTAKDAGWYRCGIQRTLDGHAH